jgi:nanoRNase/pAp phosphatase (c-di-AMP/oligoRNAs hydrolase)
LGKIFEEFGGGGHQRVGSVLLNGDQSMRARTIMECLIKEIRKHDTVSTRGIT